MNILVTKDLSKNYGDFLALDSVSLSIPEQSIFGLLGPNGAGKTTLIRIINQIIFADRGEVLFKGEKLSQKHISGIGYLPEERGLYKKMKVGEQLMYLGQLKGLSRKETNERIRYWFKRFDMTGWWEKKVEDLSKGMQQKVQFITTVLHDPKLIILDEPFSGFDPINANLIRDEIFELRRNGASVIFSTHRMETVEELCDHIALINKSKKILDGPKHEIKDAHKSHSFIIEYKGELEGTSDFFEVLHEAPGAFQGITKMEVKTSPQVRSTDLLKFFIDRVEIISFQERIPSMSEIFIRKVQGETNHE
ncbi:MAG: ATP-binding cassette domain-containing protein [Cyclobacteriaceae bacterium]|nr:ATP-binding cassette domain-containing protein [Cyclobacteriaceae bacterium]